MRTSSVQFGLDYVTLRSKSATATVTGAELIGVRGRLSLTHVELVPFGGAAEGFIWPAFKGAAASLSQPLPAALHYVEPIADVPDPGDRTPWQLVAGVRPSGEGGSARGVRLTYRSRGRTYHLDGQDTIGVFHTNARCAAFSG